VDRRVLGIGPHLHRVDERVAQRHSDLQLIRRGRAGA
jgi:hypothetical protein